MGVLIKYLPFFSYSCDRATENQEERANQHSLSNSTELSNQHLETLVLRHEGNLHFMNLLHCLHCTDSAKSSCRVQKGT